MEAVLIIALFRSCLLSLWYEKNEKEDVREMYGELRFYTVGFWSDGGDRESKWPLGYVGEIWPLGERVRGGGSGSWCTDSVLFFYLGGENRAPYCVAVHVGCTCLSPDIRSLDRWVTSSIFFFSFLMFCFFVGNWYQYLHFFFFFLLTSLTFPL